MYQTNQVLPEGYVKAMVNYDIDDTGSHIRPRYGKETMQTVHFENTNWLGAPHLSDYIYEYDNLGEIVLDTKDVVLSYGDYAEVSDLIPPDTVGYNVPLFLSNITVNGNPRKHSWSLYYDKDEKKFKEMTSSNIGYITARTIEDAYSFGMPMIGSNYGPYMKRPVAPIAKPVATVFNNELYAFAGAPFEYHWEQDQMHSYFVDFNKPDLCKLQLRDTVEGHVFNRVPIEPQEITPLQASYVGFNMLKDEPYSFKNNLADTVELTGMTPYKDPERTQVNLNFQLGEPIYFNAYYGFRSTGQKLKYKIQYYAGTYADKEKPEWTDYQDWEEFEADIETPIQFSFTPNIAYSSFRLVIEEVLDTDEDEELTEEEASEKGLPYLVVTNNSKYGPSYFANFDLSTAKGMFSWQGCLGLYGVDNAKDTLFFSDIENPSYFPYPYNTRSFDNEIIAVHNYLDNLIVVTIDGVWMLTPGVGGPMYATEVRVLSNVFIPEIDAMNLTVFKNQIFFKTDDEFYVLKPNQYTSDSTDLKNYTNSTAMSQFMENFEETVIDIVKHMYPIEQDIHTEYDKVNILDVHTQLRNEEIHYIYTLQPQFKDGDGIYHVWPDNVDLHMVYNTTSRTWRLYLCSVGDMNETNYAPLLFRHKQSGEFYEFFPHAIEDEVGITITRQTYDVVTDAIFDGRWFLLGEYNNYQYLDTGAATLDDTDTKRFRELQFNILNKEHEKISYKTDFLLDGIGKVDHTDYYVNHITDPEDPDYGKIYVIPFNPDNMEVNNLTLFTAWELDFSAFPELAMVTVRFELQGRGRRGQFRLLCTDLKRYELADITWVYRIMNAR